jgi:tetratricopeptide (TPR) repeat protein
MARNRALAAITAGLLKLDVKTEGKPDGADYFSDRSRAQLLLLFAEARQRSIRAAFRAGDAWPPEWLSDVNAAYTALAKQQNADPAAFVNYYDFLQWVGAAGRANTVLDESLTRFPNSALVHDRHRTRLLWKGGADVLERDYTDRLKKADAAADGNQLTWFAGYASLVAAEQRRRRGDRDGALSSYEHAIAHFQRNAELYPEGRDNCQHFVALAQAGEARVALERGDLDGAARAIDKSFEARADSAASLDGLGISPILTARMVKTRFAAAGNEERAAAVQASIDRLDPKILAQADIDSGEPQPRAAGGRRRPGPASRPGGR